MNVNQLALYEPEKPLVRLSGRCPEGVTPGRVRFAWPDAVRRVWRRPEPLTVSQFAERHRVMDVDGPRPGQWNNETARYLCGPMDCFNLPFVREIVVIAPPQTGKTEILLNCLVYASEYYPGPALMVYDQRELAQKMCAGRVRGAFRNSPRLRQMMTGKQDDEANFFLQLKHMRIGFAWATSVSTLSNVSVRNLFLDEVDKYEATNKQEAGPVSLAYKRVRAYRDTSKIVLSSSPTTQEGEIFKAHAKTQAHFEYVVKCPDCGHMQKMQFSRSDRKGCVRWPEGATAQDVFSRKLAWYGCENCGSVWDDYKRDRAVLGGSWRHMGSGLELMAYLSKHRPRSVGFQFSALISPLVSLSETAARFIDASGDLKVGRIDAYKDFLNGYLGETWQEDFSPRKEEALLTLRDDRPAGAVPDASRVSALIAGVDTQDYGFWFEIRAFGYGDALESWQVRAGFVETLEALERVLWTPYRDANGVPLTVQLAGIDMQGHRAEEVIAWCMKNRGRTVAIRGEQRMSQPYALKNQETYPGTDRKIPGGVKRLHVHTKYYKDALHRKLSVAPADPGAWHMNAECTLEWAKQLCAEYIGDDGNWVCPKNRDNHAWDVSVYEYCLADFLGLRYSEPESYDEEPSAPAKKSAPESRSGRRRW